MPIRKIKSYMKSVMADGKAVQSDKYSSDSYAQEGEDLLVKSLFEDLKNGFYVDIGAHDPKRFSLTYLLYLDGWRGINVDPLPGTKEKFDRIRPEDITLECGVSATEQELTYHMFNEPALNTFSPEEAKAKDGIHNGMYFLQEKKTIKTYPLKEILATNLPENRPINFMSVDAEGLDLTVLKSNDWGIYRPTLVAVEDFYTSIKQLLKESEIHIFMESQQYELISRTKKTSFYKSMG